MRYHLAPLFCRPWTLNGISPRLIESHYENNYGGALNRLNAITEELGSLDPATTPADVLSRLKRDETAALNSTLLHELYFASLGGDGRVVPNTMADAIALMGDNGWRLSTPLPDGFGTIAGRRFSRCLRVTHRA